MNLPAELSLKISIDSIILLKYNLGWDMIHYSIKNKNNKRNYVINETGEILNPNWYKYTINDVYSMDENGNYLDDAWIDDYIY